MYSNYVFLLMFDVLKVCIGLNWVVNFGLLLFIIFDFMNFFLNDILIKLFSLKLF